MVVWGAQAGSGAPGRALAWLCPWPQQLLGGGIPTLGAETVLGASQQEPPLPRHGLG